MTQPTQTEVLAYANKKVYEYLAWAETKFGMKINNLVLKFSTRDTGSLGRGGYKKIKGVSRPYLMFNLASLWLFPLRAYSEYSRFNTSSVIGGFDTTDWKLFVDTIITHELSHLMQFSYPQKLGQQPGYSIPDYGYVPFDKAHGTFFRHVYAVFRKELINPRVIGRIGIYHQNMFDRPVTTRKERARDEDHPMIGMCFVHNGQEWQVKEFIPRFNKYKCLAEYNGKKLRFSERYVNQFRV